MACVMVNLRVGRHLLLLGLVALGLELRSGPGAWAQAAAPAVSASLVQGVDQAAAGGNAAALRAAAAAMIAAANGGATALSNAVQAALAGADSTLAPRIIAAFVASSVGDTSTFVSLAVADYPDAAPQICSAAAGAAPSQAVAVVVACLQGLPAANQSAAMTQQIIAAVDVAVPEAADQITAAVGQLALVSAIQANALPTILPSSPH